MFFQPVVNIKQDILHPQTFDTVSCDVNLSQLFLFHSNYQSWEAGSSLGNKRDSNTSVSLSCLYIVDTVKKNALTLRKRKQLEVIIIQ